MILPSQYGTTPPIELLRHAEQGLIGLDQRLIGSLLARPEATLPALDILVSKPDPDRLVDLTDQVFDLYRALNAPAAIPFYLSLLLEDPTDVADELVEALAALGDAAVDPLLELHDSLPPEDAADIVFVLAATGVRHPRVAELLLASLAADPYEGSLSIGLYGDRSLAPAVRAALDALPADAAEERKALKDCIETLDAAEPRITVEPPDILSTYPEAASPLFDYLDNQQIIEFLRCPEAAYRHDAAMSLMDTQYPEPLVEVMLEVAQSDPDEQVRQAAMRALGESIEDKRVLELLSATVADPSAGSQLRTAALVGLAQAPSDEAFRNHVLKFFSETSTRAAAVEAMWRSGEEIYVPSFRTALHDSDGEVRLQAVRGVGAFPIPALAIEMIPMFSDEEMRQDALYAYASSVNAKITPKSVHRLLEEIEKKAGNLSQEEMEIVTEALDRRLEIEGYDPIFHAAPVDEDHDHSECGHDHSQDLNPALVAPGVQPQSLNGAVKAGRNDPCPCGSGKKYKKCCGQ
ncbi:MAG: HEAT repeat domain-containing protein [Bryobacteraceae bacterium]|nr:HEAT repeat domain-containing protein [Bryobacteraceae bacterium]